MIEQLGLMGSTILKVAVNDNASNAKKAISLSEFLIQYLCKIHTLQLAITDTYKKKTSMAGIYMKTVTQKTRALANFVKKSGPAQAALKKACKDVDIGYTTLKNPNDTRWNSTFTNIKSVVKLKPALLKLSNEDTTDDWSSRMLTAAEWKLAEGAMVVLEHPLLVAKSWEAEKTPTINLVIEQLYNQKTNLEGFIRNTINCRSVLLVC
jgi:hypothetical protein